jgi:Fic family protein
MQIKTFTPKKLPLRLKWAEILPYLGKAHEAIGELNEMLKTFKNPLSTLAFLKTQEALDSVHAKKSKFVSLEPPTAVVSTQRALEFALKSRQPFTNHFFLEIHRLLNTTKRRDNGKFRTKQNWIGPIGRPIEEGRYFPPKAQLVPSYLNNLRKYFFYAEKDSLVQLAIYFAQFLAIHPFMDGNGRVARILIPVFLYRKKEVKYPLLFMGGYFKRHYDAYYDRLFGISEKKDWESWIIFFLKGLVEQGKRTCRKARRLLELEKKWAEELFNILPPRLHRKFFDFIFANPVFTPQMFSLLFHLSKTTENKLFRVFQIRKVQGCYVCKNIMHAVA